MCLKVSVMYVLFEIMEVNMLSPSVLNQGSVSFSHCAEVVMYHMRLKSRRPGDLSQSYTHRV